VNPAQWRVLPEERSVMYSPVWLRPVDAFTGGALVERLRDALDLRRRDGTWAPTGISAVTTVSGAIVYPGLGRKAEPGTAPARTYRARLEGRLYRPLYLRDQDGIEFVAPPFDDFTPPGALAMPVDVELLPSLRYPFPGGVPVLRGRVVAADTPVEHALVESRFQPGPTIRSERTLTDGQGAFGLPLRWAVPGDVVTVVATDRRAQPNRVGAVAVRLPDALQLRHTITVS
jgi:hypothetical protein